MEPPGALTWNGCTACLYNSGIAVDRAIMEGTAGTTLPIGIPEQRISNFLLWQLAYTELYFTEVLWPAFDERQLDEALLWYANRQRRFGRTSDQVEQLKGA